MRTGNSDYHCAEYRCAHKSETYQTPQEVEMHLPNSCIFDDLGRTEDRRTMKRTMVSAQSICVERTLHSGMVRSRGM